MPVSRLTKSFLVGGVALSALTAASSAGGPSDGPWGPDITLCQLYDMRQFGRTGDVVGLAIATTSWNIGTVRALWENSPDSDHPFIAMNMYRLKDGRMTQIGQSWVKHGFLALSNTQCGQHPFLGGNCIATNGDFLGVGCTDTYDASLNANRTYLGPRFEINPWTGIWHYDDSMFEVGGPSSTNVRRRLQVRDADLGQNVNGNNTATYFIEAYYVAVDDVNAMNSGGWKQVSVTGNSGATYAFGVSGSGTAENEGLAVNAWTGARLTMVAPQFPIVEKWSAENAPRPGQPAPGPESPDGRAVIASNVIDLGNGRFRYEYGVFNVDMDRQISSFSIPVPEGVNVTNIGFSGVFHHDEPNTYSFLVSANNRVKGPVAVNDPWPGTRGTNTVSWSTTAHPAASPFNTVSSNPIRWGTMYNFWFEADQPAIDGLATLGLFKPGTPTSLDGLTNVPQAAPPTFCQGDADFNGIVSFDDITSILGNFSASYGAGNTGLGDSNGDGFVNFDDVTTTLGSFGTACP